jgi:hypothetical protein
MASPDSGAPQDMVRVCEFKLPALSGVPGAVLRAAPDAEGEDRAGPGAVCLFVTAGPNAEPLCVGRRRMDGGRVLGLLTWCCVSQGRAPRSWSSLGMGSRANPRPSGALPSSQHSHWTPHITQLTVGTAWQIPRPSAPGLPIHACVPTKPAPPTRDR